jgi:hypothetical protein
VQKVVEIVDRIWPSDLTYVAKKVGHSVRKKLDLVDFTKLLSRSKTFRVNFHYQILVQFSHKKNIYL